LPRCKRFVGSRCRLRRNSRNGSLWRKNTCLGEGQFEEGASWARKALAQNPRFANSFRVLAVHLAYLGRLDAAREAAAEGLRIDPDFTISRFRSRRRFLNETFWQTFSEGMRLAGLPE
jgi:tetratricopeptide (TPR) repeat protein